MNTTDIGKRVEHILTEFTYEHILIDLFQDKETQRWLCKLLILYLDDDDRYTIIVEPAENYKVITP